MICAMDAIYKYGTLFHSRLKVLENTITVSVKDAFNDLQINNNGINEHNDNQNKLD